MVAIAAASSSGQDKPKSNPKLGFFVYVLASAAVIGGFLFGYDTSVVSAAMLYMPDSPGLKPMNTVWQEVIVSISPGMAAVGSLMSGASSDYLGRRKVILGASAVFTIGALVCAASVNKIMLLVGRILLGIAIGFASMIVPVYLGETAPTHIRGMLVAAFALMISFGQVVANITGGAFSYIDPYNIGWRLMFAFAAVPSLIQFICFMFLPETPRWLYENGYEFETRAVLEKVYNGDKEWVEYEMEEIIAFSEEQKKENEKLGYQGPVIWRVLKTPHVLKACFIGSMLQAFQQLAGINTILYYTADIIRSSGISNNHTTIWISVLLSLCNFIGPFIPMSLIERTGRRIIFLFSCGFVVISLCFIGVAFLLVNHDSAATYPENMYSSNSSFNSTFQNAQKCMKYTTVINQNCPESELFESELSCIRTVLYQNCPKAELSRIRTVLNQNCPDSELFVSELSRIRTVRIRTAPNQNYSISMLTA
uniref:MFS domain-containing protein n=1 Tax=Caenorhabditis japonica TaxID=281687 RepID=A0A8R1HIQ5_CAEJA